MQIIQLARDRYAGKPLNYSFDSTSRLFVREEKAEGMPAFFLEKHPADRLHITFVTCLYPKQAADASAFGLVDNEGRLSGVIQLCPRESGLLHVMDLLVFEGYRRRGYGSLLLSKGKAQARYLGCRGLTLRLSSENTGAYAFLTRQGMRMTGFDLSCKRAEETNPRFLIDMGCEV